MPFVSCRMTVKKNSKMKVEGNTFKKLFRRSNSASFLPTIRDLTAHETLLAELSRFWTQCGVCKHESSLYICVLAKTL